MYTLKDYYQDLSKEYIKFKEYINSISYDWCIKIFDAMIFDRYYDFQLYVEDYTARQEYKQILDKLVKANILQQPTGLYDLHPYSLFSKTMILTLLTEEFDSVQACTMIPKLYNKLNPHIENLKQLLETANGSSYNAYILRLNTKDFDFLIFPSHIIKLVKNSYLSKELALREVEINCILCGDICASLMPIKSYYFDDSEEANGYYSGLIVYDNIGDISNAAREMSSFSTVGINFEEVVETNKLYYSSLQPENNTLLEIGNFASIEPIYLVLAEGRYLNLNYYFLSINEKLFYKRDIWKQAVISQ